MSTKFARIYAAQPYHLAGHPITVEIDISRGLNAFTIVGLPDKAVEESRDRVGSALKNAGFSSPKHSNQKTIVSLSPAELKKEGSFFDVAIALGYLLATQEIAFDPEKKLFAGALALNGDLQPIRGGLPLAQTAKREGFRELYLPADNAEEAALVDGITIYPMRTLRELVEHIEYENSEDGESLGQPIKAQAPTDIPENMVHSYTDFEDVKGQEVAKRGLEIAAAGGHNVAMYGPPGTGKTMLARAFTGILPSLEKESLLEINGIHSIAGTLDGKMVTTAPFRSPHHTSSYVSVIGGGVVPQPGEVTLAHQGVLFLDEFPEFDKRVLESLRQPLEDRIVTIARAQGTAKFPADFILLAAMNPCPCGYFGSSQKMCSCTPSGIQRYKRKVSGPIMDRIDIWLEVEHIEYDKLSDKNLPKGETSDTVRDRVNQARQKQYQRASKTNTQLSAKDLDKVTLNDEPLEMLHKSANQLALSPRAYHRVIKLARTIADLDNKDRIETPHVLEALQYRPRQ